jgi:osmotically-inducible protein OsmY
MLFPPKQFKKLVPVLALIATLPALQGCFPVVAAGVVTTALSVSDRRTTGAQLEDQGIELKADSRIRERFGSQVSAGTVSFNRRVLVYGQAPDAATQQEVGRLVSAVPNVREVINEIEIAGTAGLGTASSDSVVTTKVKASLVDAKDIQANGIKVVTERGVVYLLGLVTEREAGRAAQVAAGVSGVVKVVKVFEIISEAQLAEMQKQPQQNSKGKSQ